MISIAQSLPALFSSFFLFPFLLTYSPAFAQRYFVSSTASVLSSYSLVVQGTIYKANTVRYPAIKLHNAPLRFTGYLFLSLSVSFAFSLPSLCASSSCIESTDRHLYTAYLVPPSAFTPYLGLTRQRIN